MATNAFASCTSCSDRWELSKAELVATPAMCPRCRAQIHGDEEGQRLTPSTPIPKAPRGRKVEKNK